MSAVELVNGRAPGRPAILPPRPAPQIVDQVSLKTWLAVGGAIIGAFMAVLNIQIVNASLPDIQGAIGAGIDDGGWISTAYLVAEIVVIPLTGFLARVFSVRTYLLANAVLFLAFSASCAFAHTLGQMIVLRAFQGFTGGVLIPMAFTITLTMLPKSKQPVGLALFALSATFAPAIGPTIGGYLTENWGWQYIFYINLVPGALMVAALFVSLDRSTMRLDLLRHGDWPGIATMAVGLASLQTVLEEGNKDDWFSSPFILRLSVIAAVSLSAFIVIELKAAQPLLNLRLLARRNFGLGVVASVLLGLALYGSVYLLPLYLSQTQGYNSEQVGEVLAWTGLPQLVLIPLTPMLMKRFDARWLIVFGFTLFAASCFFNMHLSANYAGPQLLWPNIVRAIGQSMLMTPLSAVTTGGIELEAAGSASALYNMMRNLGGAFGIAILQTFLTKREQFHSAVLTPDVSLFDPATRARIAAIAHDLAARTLGDPQAAWHQAVIAIGREIRQQAFFMAYGDAFALIGVALALAALCTLAMRAPKALGGGGH